MRVALIATPIPCDPPVATVGTRCGSLGTAGRCRPAYTAEGGGSFAAPYRARSLRRAKKRRDMAQETRDRAQRERVEKLKAALLRNEEIRQQSLQAQ